MPLAIALFVSVSGKQTSDSNKPPPAASKQLVGSLSNKAITFVYKNKLKGIEVEEGFGERRGMAEVNFDG